MKEFFVEFWRDNGPPVVFAVVIVSAFFVGGILVMENGEHHECVNRCAGDVVASDTVTAVEARRQHCDELCKARNK